MASKITISPVCAESYPCQHDVTITDPNGKMIEKRMNGRDIYALILEHGLTRETCPNYDHFVEYAK